MHIILCHFLLYYRPTVIPDQIKKKKKEKFLPNVCGCRATGCFSIAWLTCE